MELLYKQKLRFFKDVSNAQLKQGKYRSRKNTKNKRNWLKNDD